MTTDGLYSGIIEALSKFVARRELKQAAFVIEARPGEELLPSKAGYHVMVYRVFQSGEFDAETTAMMMVIFEEVCAEMRLAAREDALRDIVAFEIKKCVQDDHRDLAYIRDCARRALVLHHRTGASSAP